MEKTGLPRPELDPKPEKQAGDKEAKFVGEDTLVDRFVRAHPPGKSVKPIERDTK